MESSAADAKERSSARGSTAFALSIVALVVASAFAGAMLRPWAERWKRPTVPSASELAVFLEHADVDVRLGRAAPLAERLRWLAGHVREASLRERILGLWTEAALQAQRLDEAANAEEQREGLVQDPGVRAAIRLRRIGLAASLGQPSVAAELAAPLVAGEDARIADEARLRLAAAMSEKELRGWIADRRPREVEESRRAGLAALRLLGDAPEAERLLGAAEQAGQRDASLYRALVEVYARLDRPRDLARVSAALLGLTRDVRERADVELLHAEALARANDVAGALAALDALKRSPEPAASQAARRARYEVLRRAGRLEREIASLHDPAERAFVALEVERDYEKAARLYRAASEARPDSPELAAGLREAERRRELGERRALYLQVLAKDPQDETTRDKLLAVLGALGEDDAARRLLGAGPDDDAAAPDALVARAQALGKAGLARDAAAYLERAYAAEKDTAKRQRILFSLGDLYAAGRQEEEARRLYASLAADGVSPEVRERAVARLASLSR